MTPRTFAGVGSHQPEQCLLVAARDTVDRHHQNRAAGASARLISAFATSKLGEA